MDCQVVEPGLEVQGEAVPEGSVPQGIAQCCPIVHLEFVVAEALVEASEVVDEPQAVVLLGFPEDGYLVLRGACFLLREVANRSLLHILVDHVGQENRLVKRLGDTAGDRD